MDGIFALYGLLALTTLPPLVPNFALLVSAGVLASEGHLALPLVLAVVAGSALLGDALMYLAARRFGGPVRTWMLRRPRRRTALEWTSRRIRCHGVPFVIAVRFLPSGRIVGPLASGVLRYSPRKYLIGAGLAESLWAAYSIGLGYLGSAAAAGNRLCAAGIGLGVSALVAMAGGGVQWAARRRTLRARSDRCVTGELPLADRGTARGPGGGTGREAGCEEGDDQASSSTPA
ncbi:DedA family protein [Streptomyces sp. BHT-5-2]|uniref:DedA family protein n=1 Tax=unclassified Streptomyces TaxID=2593676 RepID=UPI001C8E4510|nr:DedA family protein [Streptomyces sp. BHT-5-2]QZL02075.1 DedA family protein [Streptomyces sp. BHT-5-2]